MSAIDFVVRGDAGVSQRGSLGGADGNSLVAGAGQDVSLNLSRGDILSYVRQGQALQVTLVDGTVLTVEGFFSTAGEPVADLFISANGTLAQAQLVAGEGNLLFAQYVDADSFGKWSPDDDLYFVRGSDVLVDGVVPVTEATQLGGGLLGGISGLGGLGAGAAALGGAGLLLAGSGGGDDEESDVAGVSDEADEPDAEDEPEAEDPPVEDPPAEDPVVVEDPVIEDPEEEGEPEVEDPPVEEPPVVIDPPVVAITDGTESAGVVVNADDFSDGIEISGTGTPNTTGTIMVGDDLMVDIETDDDGVWSVVFTEDQIPGGEFTEDVKVTLTNEGGSTTTTDVLVVDTIASVTINTEIVEGNGQINFAEESDGFTLTGTVEAGSTVTVTFGGVTYDAVVTGSSWSLDVAAGVIEQGEYDLNIDVNSVDAFGNTASTSGTVNIDTVAAVTIDTASVEGNGQINFAEESDGFQLTGTTQAGSTVTVTFGGVTYDAVVSGSSWTLDVPAGVIAQGEYDLEIDVNAVDAVGNTASTSGTVNIDTVTSLTLDDSAGGADGVVNAVEHTSGIELNGLAEAGATVVVTLGAVSHTVTATSTGTWSSIFNSDELPTGNLQDVPVNAVSTDLVGNTATATGSVTIDTVIDVTVDENAGGADSVVNAVERGDTITLFGQTDANASVAVAFNGIAQTVSADADGNWTADYAGSTIPQNAEGTADVSVVATDAAGNTATASTTVEFDTFVNRLGFTSGENDNEFINRADAADGVTLNGVVEAGSTVNVSFGGVTQQASVAANGNWTVTFTPAQVALAAAGEVDAFTANIVVDATDAAGNVASIEDTVQVDLVAPDAVDFRGVFIEDDSVTAAALDAPEPNATFDQLVNGADAAQVISLDAGTGPTFFDFSDSSAIPQGSHLVVTNNDEAGNSTSTLVVLQGTEPVDLSAGALDGFNIAEINLETTDSVNLTLSVEQLQALSGDSNELVIHGDESDSVTIDLTNANLTGTQTIGTETFDVYDFGDDTSLIIDQEINLNPVV